VKSVQLRKVGRPRNKNAVLLEVLADGEEARRESSCPCEAERTSHGPWRDRKNVMSESIGDYWNFQEHLGKISHGVVNPGREGDGSGSGEAARPVAAAASAVVTDASSYLETLRKEVTEKEEKNERKRNKKKDESEHVGKLEVRSCGCKSRFCSTCCLFLGIQTKNKLKVRLKEFNRIMMLTFTIDQQLFATPSEAQAFVQKNRCIGVTMQKLRRRHVLNSCDWFCVIEWQANGWPHWHVLVDSDYIAFDTLANAWNVNWKEAEERIKLGRPGFGSVRFTKSDFKNADHAANYAAKYLTKHPDNGYPDWVLDSSTRHVHRYSTSRGFWNGVQVSDAQDEANTPDIDPDDALDEDETPEPPDSNHQRRTIRQQVATCGQSSVVLRLVERVDPATGQVKIVRQFVKQVMLPIDDLLGHCTVIERAKNGRSAIVESVNLPASSRADPRTPPVWLSKQTEFDQVTEPLIIFET